MEHPFAQLKELEPQQQQSVSGGTTMVDTGSDFTSPEIIPPFIKPPIATTMAYGEEGGVIGTWF